MTVRDSARRPAPSRSTPIGTFVCTKCILSYATLNPVVACSSGTGIDENCTGDNLPSSQVLGLTLGALF